MILRRFFNNYLVSGAASISVISIISGAFVSFSAHAVDLLEVYNQSLKTYPVLKSQEYIAKSVAVGDPIARATAFFPTVTTSASYAREHSSISGVGTTTATTELNLNLTQPIFNYVSYQSWRSAKWAAKSAFSKYSSQKQIFITNVVTAYFAVLQAKENLDSAKATERYSEMTLNVVKEKMKVGLSTMNEVNQALATYDTRLAGRVAAENAVQTAEQNLSVYTGEVYDKYAVLREDFIFDDPKGALKEWEDSAQQNNNILIAQRQALQQYAHILSSSRGAYFPSVSLSASYGYQKNIESTLGIVLDSSSKTYTVALNLLWNLFNGFKDFETVKQNAYLYGSQEATTAFQVRDVSNRVNTDYLNVKSYASQVKADLEAVIAGESAVKQALAQYQVGVCVGSSCDDSSSSSSSASGSSSTSSSASSSPLVNLLEQIKLLQASQLSYSTSKYAYINAKLALANDAGFISDKQVIALNKWLTYKVPKDFSYKYPY